MASSDNQINILLKAQDQATATIREASRNIQQSADRVTSSSKDVANGSTSASSGVGKLGSSLTALRDRLVAVGVAFGAYQIVQQVRNMGEAIFKAGGELEQTNMSYQALLGNVDKANTLFSQLTQYANQTPFTSMEIGGAAKQLLAFGQNGDEAIKTVKQLGDVAAAGGGDLQGLSLVVGQVFAQGSMHAQDMYQIINNGGAGLIKIMAANAGGMQKLTEQFDSGGVKADDFFKAIKQATDKGGFAFRGAQKQAGTLNGLLSTLQDSATIFGEKLIGIHVDPSLGLVIDKGGLFDRAKGVVTGLIDGFNMMGDRAGTIMPKIMDKMQGVANKVQDALAPMIDLLRDKFDRHFPHIKEVLEQTASKMEDRLGGAFNFIAAKAQEKLPLVISKAVELYHKVVDYLTPSFTELKQNVQQYLMPTLERLWRNVLKPLIEAVAAGGGAGLVGALKLLMDTINFVLPIIDGFTRWAEDNQGTVGLLIGAIVVLKTTMIITETIAAFQVAFATGMAGATTSVGGVTGAVTAMRTLVSSPIGMGGIAVAGALADIGLVMAAVQAVRGAIEEVNKAAAAAESLKNQKQATANEYRYVISHGSQYKPFQVQNAQRELKFLEAQGFASGGYTGRGGVNDVAGVVHKGEYVLPQSQVDQRTGTPKMGGIQIGQLHIHNEIDEQRFLAKVGWRLALR